MRTRQRLGVLALGLAGALLLVPWACRFDASGLRSPEEGDATVSPDATARDAGPPTDAGPGLDGAGLDGAATDGHVDLVDAAPDAYVPPCTGDTFECRADGTARVCQNDDWVDLGACPLGCNETSRACAVPSNVPAAQADDGNGSATFASAASPVHIDTDTGRIYTPSGPEIRPAGNGLDAGSGIFYGQQPQGTDPGVGVFVLSDLTVDAGVEVYVEGSRSLLILASGNVTLNGVIYANSVDDVPGPGGFPGGAAGQPGAGACAGQVGASSVGTHGCSSGGGGGGHGGLGGAGGDADCGGHTGGAGGVDTCGTAALVPLVGGYGGAGGSLYGGDPTDMAGPGGGGGGAVQLTAGGAITVGTGGGIHVGGGPGGGCSAAGGAGGGAGGGILLESPTVTLDSGATLAANGGGGGGGDCT